MVQEITYEVLYNHFHNFGETVLGEIGFKLGNKESSPKNIYFARFIMLLANHVAPEMVFNRLENKLTGWVQNKRLFKDLVRINLHEGTKLRLPHVIQVFLSTNLSTLTSLPSSVAMEGEKDPNPLAPATKIKKPSKFKSKTTSGVSQTAPVVKPTKSQPVGSEQCVRKVGDLGKIKVPKRIRKESL